MTEDQCDLAQSTLLDKCGCAAPEASSEAIAESFFDTKVFCTACSDGTPTTEPVAVGGKTCGQWDSEGRSFQLSVSECLSLQTATSVAPDDPCQCGTGGGGPGPAPGPTPGPGPSPVAPPTTPAPTLPPTPSCAPTDIQLTLIQKLRDPAGFEDYSGPFTGGSDGSSTTERIETSCLPAGSYTRGFNNLAVSSTSAVL